MVFLNPIHENIPDELKQRKQWVCWRAEMRNNKNTKVPYDPRTGLRAGSIYCWTWADFENAIQTMEKKRFDGIGFVFAEEDDFIGIDLDHILDKDGQIIVPWAAEIVKKLASYTELSVSGDGLHILAKGKIPRSGTDGKQGDQPHIEMYKSGRYFCMTGHLWGE
jgi:putative DNA primase/helicase